VPASPVTSSSGRPSTCPSGRVPALQGHVTALARPLPGIGRRRRPRPHARHTAGSGWARRCPRPLPAALRQKRGPRHPGSPCLVPGGRHGEREALGKVFVEGLDQRIPGLAAASRAGRAPGSPGESVSTRPPMPHEPWVCRQPCTLWWTRGCGAAAPTAADWPKLVAAAYRAAHDGGRCRRVWSHLACADDPSIARFANSAATLTMPANRFDMVRPELAIYVLDPMAPENPLTWSPCAQP
jgi:hypothetical protein